MKIKAMITTGCLKLSGLYAKIKLIGIRATPINALKSLIVKLYKSVLLDTLNMLPIKARPVCRTRYVTRTAALMIPKILIPLAPP